MRALVWIIEDTWEATVAEAAALLPPRRRGHAPARREHRSRNRRPRAPAAACWADTPLHTRRRSRCARSPSRPRDELLAEAQTQLGRPAQLEARRGRVEREVVAAAEHMDILVLARDGDRERLGPRSLGPATRFVVDHAPCRVLLIWPDVAPALTTIPPPPPPPR